MYDIGAPLTKLVQHSTCVELAPSREKTHSDTSHETYSMMYHVLHQVTVYMPVLQQTPVLFALSNKSDHT
jgi:hypothetical protein